MTREDMLAVVAKVTAVVERPVAISSGEYSELRHALERLAAESALPVGVGEVIDTALIWLWSLANHPHAVVDGEAQEMRSRLRHDLARMQGLITPQELEKG